MSKGGDTSVSQMVDPNTQAYVNQMRQAALGYAGLGGTPTYRDPARASRLQAIAAKGGPLGSLAQRELDAMTTPGSANPGAGLPQATIDPALLAALQGYQGYADIGKMGLTALSGGANPWMDASNPLYADLRAQTLNSIGDQAQLSGAFGGDRQGVTSGAALGQIAKDQAAEAYGHAAQAAGFGLAGLGGQADLARYIQEYPQLFAGRQLGILNAGIGPYGTTQTQQTTGDPFSQLLGLGTLFLPGGPLAGLLKSGASSMAIPMVI